MTKEEALLKIEQGDGDFHVETADERKTFLNKLKDTEEFKQQIDLRIGDLEKKYDDDLYTLSGEKKKDGERTYDFMKRKFKEMNDNSDVLKSQNEELEKAVKDKTGDKALDLAKGEIDSMKKKHQTYKDDADKKYTDLEQSGVQMRIQHEFDKSMTGLKFQAAIPDVARDAMINAVKGELLKSSSFVDGQLVFLGEDGKILRDDNLNVVTPKDILTEKLKSIIDPGRIQEGVDTETSIEETDGKINVNISIPDHVKTNVDLTEHLLKSGFKRDTKEYRAAYAKYSEKLEKVT